MSVGFSTTLELCFQCLPHEHTVELAVHTLLYVRQIYPFSLFEQRIVYDIPVYQCADDVIRQYIWKAMDALAEELLVVSHV